MAKNYVIMFPAHKNEDDVRWTLKYALLAITVARGKKLELFPKDNIYIVEPQNSYKEKNTSTIHHPELFQSNYVTILIFVFPFLRKKL